MNHRTLLLAALPLLVASCNVQESTPPSAQEGVILAPRFARTAAVPDADSVTAVLKTESGEHDTSRTVLFSRGGSITLGKLPPGVRFTLTLTGWSNVGGKPVVAWWTSAKDSSGSNTVHTVYLPDPVRSADPLGSASIPASSRPANGGDSVLFQGKPIAFPVGTYITTDGSDPRTNPSAKLATQTDTTDSVSTINVAVKTEENLASGHPELWSPVKTFHLVVDPLDTLTFLDTLFLSTYKKLVLDTPLINPIIQSPSPVGPTRTDTLDHVEFDPSHASASRLYLYATPSSDRATIQAGATEIPLRTFTEIPFPADSTLELTVNNHDRSRTYRVKFVRVASANHINKKLDSLKSPSPGLTRDRLNSSLFLIELPPGQDTLQLQAFPSPQCSVHIGDVVGLFGQTLTIPVGLDTATIAIKVFAPDVPNFVGYTLQVRHAKPLAFRDTTYGVPWRNVAYDSFVYNSRKYRTVVVGTARWMAENLNYRVDSSFCAILTVDSCAKYGRRYTWSGAADTTPKYDSVALPFTGPLQGACPAGWHLPSQVEWQTLIDLVGANRAGTLLRSFGNSWAKGGGMDSLGMRILPAGMRQRRFTGEDEIPPEIGGDAWFWTSTLGPSASQMYAVHFSGTSTLAAFEPHFKVHAFSVRCVSDTAVVAP